LGAIGRDVPWNEAWDLTSGLLRDPWSHTGAALAGWAYVPDPVEAATLNLVDAYRLMNHAKGKVRPSPLPRPWATTRKASDPTRVRVPDPERATRRARLAERLGVPAP